MKCHEKYHTRSRYILKHIQIYWLHHTDQSYSQKYLYVNRRRGGYVTNDHSMYTVLMGEREERSGKTDRYKEQQTRTEKTTGRDCLLVCFFVGCLTSQQHASVSQGPICSDKFTCCHTEIEVAGQTVYLTQSQYTDTRPTSPSTDPIMPGAWQGSHWSANFYVTGMTRPGKIPLQAGFEPQILHTRGGRLNH